MPNDRKGKWQPFDALTGYRSALEKVEYEKGKIKKPILASDELEALDYKITKAIKNKADTEIVYYSDGYIKYVNGKIFVDLHNKHIKVNSKIIKLNDIIDIRMIDYEE